MPLANFFLVQFDFRKQNAENAINTVEETNRRCLYSLLIRLVMEVQYTKKTGGMQQLLNEPPSWLVSNLKYAGVFGERSISGK